MSAARRWLLFFAGWLCIGLGLLGAVLPVLPTTPFILLAAACFARSSPRFHAWLRDSRLFGEMVREWEAHRSIPYRTKVRAIVVMALTMGVSVVFFVKPLVVKGVVAASGLALAFWLYSLPSRDKPVDQAGPDS